MGPKILFEDDSLIVLEKPAGMVVNRAESVKGKTLQDWVEEILEIGNWKLEIPSSDFIRRSGIVHRLDKETSGLLLVAKNPEVLTNLQKQFKERRVEKRYLALVHGQVEPGQGVIEASISRSPFDRKKFGVFLGGRAARTEYWAKDSYHHDSEKYTLVELLPTTGRTHQLRVHLKYINHPVVADEKYAGRKTARADRQWCPRQFLHASFLAFTHPQTGEKVEFTSELPVELKKALKTLHI